jgi:hypothetical protein
MLTVAVGTPSVPLPLILLAPWGTIVPAAIDRFIGTFQPGAL